MRAIINVVSDRAAAVTGWRVREVESAGDSATLQDILKSAGTREANRSLYDLVADDSVLKNDFALFVGGDFIQGDASLARAMRDSEQIHLWDWPFSVRDS